jgi:hypothetical protein
MREKPPFILIYKSAVVLRPSKSAMSHTHTPIKKKKNFDWGMGRYIFKENFECSKYSQLFF